MNRSIRTFLVLAVAIGVAGAATYLVYKTIQSQPTREVEIASAHAVVAARSLPVGTRLAATDVKLVPWPAANPVVGGFTKIEDLVDRGLIAAVAENEPLNGNNVASKEAGAGLPPTIPSGMRAISVKVNEVIGVAGFVVPGTRVDVMVILREGAKSLARVVVGNVQVLAAGTSYDQGQAREGKALPTSVVTLLVSPGDAELVGLAATEGQIMLTLRNPTDTAVAPSIGTVSASLSGDNAPRPASATGAPPVRRAAAPPTAPVIAPPAPPPPPKPVVVIRGGVIKEIIK